MSTAAVSSTLLVAGALAGLRDAPNSPSAVSSAARQGLRRLAVVRFACIVMVMALGCATCRRTRGGTSVRVLPRGFPRNRTRPIRQVIGYVTNFFNGLRP